MTKVLTWLYLVTSLVAYVAGVVTLVMLTLNLNLFLGIGTAVVMVFTSAWLYDICVDSWKEGTE